MLHNASAQTHTLIDTGSPLKDIYNIRVNGDHNFLISDAKPSLALYRNYKFDHVIGKRGNGPCEFTDSFVNSLRNDTLYLVDDNQNKLITYNIKTGGCLAVKTNRIFGIINSITPVGDTLYLTRGYFKPFTGTTDAVFYKYNLADGSISPLKLRFGDLNAIHFKVPIKIDMGTRTHIRNDTLFFFYPMTHQVWEYNMENGQFTSLILNGMQWPRKQLENTKGRGEMFKLLKKMEVIRDVFPLSDYLAVSTFKPFSEKQDWKVQFYTYQGVFIYSLDVGHYVVSMNDKSLTELVSDTSKTHKYALRTVTYR